MAASKRWFNKVVDAVSKEFMVDRRLLMGSTRGPKLVAQARQAAYLIVKEQANWLTWREVAELFDRHRTAASYGAWVAAERRRVDWVYADRMKRVTDAAAAALHA